MKSWVSCTDGPLNSFERLLVYNAINGAQNEHRYAS